MTENGSTTVGALSYNVQRVQATSPNGVVLASTLPIYLISGSAINFPTPFRLQSDFDAALSAEKAYVLTLYDDIFVGPLSSLWNAAKFIGNNLTNSNNPAVIEQDRQLVAVIQYLKNHRSEVTSGVLSALENTWAQAKDGDPAAVGHLASVIPSIVGPGVVIKALKEFDIAGNAGEAAIKLSVDSNKIVQSATGPITAVEGETVTIIGSYQSDGGMASIINELNYPKTYDFGPKTGSYNILNIPDSIANSAISDGSWWKTYNEPFLASAVDRGDIIAVATKPNAAAMFVNGKNASGGLTGFGQEIEYLESRGYTFDINTSTMVKVVGAQ